LILLFCWYCSKPYLSHNLIKGEVKIRAGTGKNWLGYLKGEKKGSFRTNILIFTVCRLKIGIYGICPYSHTVLFYKDCYK
jgi:hypothetical protein